MTTLEVVRSGPLALIEDEGRPGWSAIGVGRSGAADRASYRLANRLLANPAGAAAIEVLLGGLEVVARGGDAWVAVTGAPARLTVDARAVDPYAAVALREGQRLRMGLPPAGLRSYVAVRGGIDVPPVLGSRSRDVLAGIGPEPLAAGDRLVVGPAPAAYPHVDAVPAPAYEDEVVLRVVRGPRDDWILDPDLLVGATWHASANTDRVGMRLDGPPLRLVRPDRQLPSEGAVRGAIQVPPSGEPVVFLADHPVTGGYPVVGVVVDADVDRAAQVRPGTPLRLRWA
ncbi:biotin-dependent carboxyltransferase family protein [Mumia zhuanghuii]|uniref:Biotin-dependent carboxyltransferase family protein n=2 Tax=Mumia TaxID=1546255 RepID=A0ABW1QQG1_9ACTN|nr:MULTISPECIES: biotin-dependent carboxyltransferase family protein [Mumia]KAA1423779.1 biotin-dependent carboxyltransferase family protein [Mumia zhuanghuii]